MSCRCRDMEKKRCRWEHKTDSWTLHLKEQTKRDRREAKAAMRKLVGVK